jgi:hypothetical protein
MEPKRWQGKIGTLGGLILLGMIYGGLLLWLRTVTGRPVLDGTIGVVLGLYICSHPAANAVDLLFFERNALRQSGWSGLGWLALNFLVLVIGWWVIAIGATRFAWRTG